MAGNDTFRTHKRASNFTMIQNALINQPTLSWAAKGILIYLLSKPDGWKVYTADIVKHATNGKDSVKTLTKELRAAGYITLSKIVDSKGRVKEWRYDVYDEPLQTPFAGIITVRLTDNVESIATYPEHYNDDYAPAEESLPEAPEVAFPEVGAPDVENPPTSNIDNNKTKRTNTLSIPSCKGGVEGSVVSSEYEYEQIVAQLKANIEYDIVAPRPEYDGWLEGWIFMLADFLISAGNMVKVNGRPISKKMALQRFLTLDAYHFRQVKESLEKVTYPIRNMRGYILSSLYNVPTISDDLIVNQIQST